MHVHVNIFVAHFDEQQRRRMATARDQRLVGLLDCANQHSIAHRAAVDEREDHPAGGERLMAGCRKSLRANPGAIEVERKHPGRDFGTEHLAKSLERRVGARQIEDRAAVGGQAKRDVMVGERDPLKGVGDGALLGRQRLQELEPRRSVEEQLADLDSGSRRHRTRPGILDIAGVDCDLDAVLVGGAPRLHPKMRDAGDRGERLAAKPERANRAQVGGASNL